MAWTLTPAHQDARNAAAQAAANAQTIALADAGAAASTVRLYDTAAPATRLLLATIVLDKPCASIVDGKIALHQASPVGDIVAATGIPTWAEWLDGAAALLATCTVSPEEGDGDLKISSRADGQIFAGGFITLEEGLIG